MIRALVWKEYREQRTIWVALAGLGMLIVYGLMQWMAPQGASSGSKDDMTLVCLMTMLMAATYGLVCGAMLFANEREVGTQTFLDVLTGWRAGVWRGKLLAGVMLVLTESCLMGVVVHFLGLTTVQGLPSGWVLSLPIVALEALAWGMCFSPLFRNVLPAAGTAALPWAICWFPSAGVLFADQPGNEMTPLVLHTVRGTLALLALGISAFIYCRPDHGRQPSSVRVTRRASPERLGVWRSLLWLAIRQGRWTVVVLAVLGLGVGAVLPLFAWPIFTLFLGIVCGINVFAGEQSTGANRFLGDQRVPPAQVWLVKTLFWLSVGTVMAILVALEWAVGGAFKGRHDLYQFEESLEGYRYLGFWGFSRLAPWNNVALVALYVTMWFLYGFSLGQFFGLVVRKSVVALVLTILISASVLAFWLPSLLMGGLPPWQPLLIPVILLLATRLVMRAWLGGRLTARMPVAVLAGGGLLGMACLMGALAYRVHEIPDVGDPFDVRAFARSIPSPENNKGGEEVRQAIRELNDHITLIGPKLPMPLVVEQPNDDPPMLPADDEPRRPAIPGGPAGAGAGAPGGIPAPGWAPVVEEDSFLPPRARLNRFMEEAYTVIEHGWPAHDPGLEPCLDLLFKENWADHLRAAAAQSTGMVENVANMDVRTPLYLLDGCREASLWLGARALQLQARGNDEAALDHIVYLLALSRQLRGHAVLVVYYTALNTETIALQALDQWLRHLRKPTLLRRALQELARYEGTLPPLTDHLKAEYLMTRNTLNSPGWFPRYALLALQIPWERTRQERILNVAYTIYFRTVEKDFAEQEAGFASARQQWNLLDSQSPALMAMLPGSINKIVLNSRASLCRLRGTRLQIALALYEAEKGKPVARLDDLIPDYLPTLPTDPYSGRPFHYRVTAEEETLRVESTAEGTRGALVERKVPAGQGIVWSVGPDGLDNGGTKDGRGLNPLDIYHWSSWGLDWLFFVPRLAGL